MNVPFLRSITTRLGGSALALMLGATTLALANTWLVRDLSGDAAWTDLLAEGSAHQNAVVVAADGYLNAPAAERDRARSEVAEAARAMDRRYAALRSGDPDRGAPPIKDEALLRGIREREDLWRTRVRPLVASIMAARSRDEVATELAEVRSLTREFARSLTDSTRAAERVVASKIARFEEVQVALLVGFLALGTVVLLVSRGITGRVVTLARAAGAIGQGDLSDPPEVPGDDELTALSRAFRDMTRRLREGLETERVVRSQLERAMAAIRDTATSLASASKEIAASTAEQGATAQQQMASVAETTVTTEELARTSEEGAKQARAAADTARESEHAASEGRSASERALETVRGARARAEAVVQAIVQLAERAQAIGEVIALVDDLADQTSMLALNASIEASRAGAQGKGFSVVAAEIRSLSEQAKRATVDVRRMLGEVQRIATGAAQSTDAYSRSMEETTRAAQVAGDAIRALSAAIADMAEGSERMAASADQTATGLRQIDQAMREIRAASEQATAAVRQSDQAARDIEGLARRLTELLFAPAQTARAS